MRGQSPAAAGRALLPASSPGRPAAQSVTRQTVLHPDHIGPDSPPPTPARRAEIDGFLRLLEDARAQVAAGSPFTLALIAPRRAHHDEEEAGRGACCRPAATLDAGHAADSPDAGREADALAEAHNFLALNLRRRDGVAFYGPTLLAALLPSGRARRADDDLARLFAEFHAAPGTRAPLAAGLASFPGDGADIEALVLRAEAALDAALARETGARPTLDASAHDESPAPESVALESAALESAAPESVTPAPAAEIDAHVDGEEPGDDGGRAAAEPARPAQDFLPLHESGARSSAGWRVGEGSLDGTAARASSKRGLQTQFSSKRALRESKRGDDFGAMVLPSFESAAAGGVLARAAAEAAARERERRANGARLPGRLLLAVSDAARMAQVNMLLRSAGYEVRAAFDGKQTLDLLRIERADLLVLDFALAGVDGLEVLRRLGERHGGQLPLPVVLLVPAEQDGEELRAGAARLGAGGFVPLPYDPQELLDCVGAAGGDDG